MAAATALSWLLQGISGAHKPGKPRPHVAEAVAEVLSSRAARHRGAYWPGVETPAAYSLQRRRRLRLRLYQVV
jgi:hypothetical protein